MAGQAPATAPPRRTRAGQREATRARLIDATFKSLVERGYAGTTTAVIAQEAGVSHGALFNHFASKDELMAACISEVFPRFMAEGSEHLLALVTTGTTGRTSMDRVIDVLWNQFCGPTMQAMRELMMAGRTNDGLSSALADLDAVVREANVQLAALLVPEIADHPRLRAYVNLTLATIDGAAFASQAFRDPERHAETKTALVHALELLIADAAGDGYERVPLEPLHTLPQR